MDSFLFSHRFKKIGWFIFIPSLFAGIFVMLTEYKLPGLQCNMLVLFDSTSFDLKELGKIKNVDLTNTLFGALFIIGGILVGFSKEKIEDEYIAKLRYRSVLWAVLVNYLILLFTFIFIYDFAFLNVMIYNMFTTIIIYIARFNFLLFKIGK